MVHAALQEVRPAPRLGIERPDDSRTPGFLGGGGVPDIPAWLSRHSRPSRKSRARISMVSNPGGTTQGTTMSEKTDSNGVKLGCGTLIIIALIVMFFSGSRDTREMRARLDELNRRVERIEKKIDALSGERAPGAQ
jgi:1,6-anhydro-N-acetylmuramate kinase